mgnify:CR=1 FL=1
MCNFIIRSMKRYQHILFDLDGTLTDPQEGIINSVQYALKRFGIKKENHELLYFIGPPLHKSFEAIFGTEEKAFEVEATVHSILKCERLVLNCMQRMSGIATLTAAYVKKLKGYKTRLLDTRKTTPNFRLLEKEAVRIGGGINHRFGLYDMIMLKDNHIDYCGGIEKAIEKASVYVQNEKPGLKIEVETRTIDEVKKVIAVGKGKVFRIMLDNFKLKQIKEAVKLIGKDFEMEASGGINLDNIEDYAKTGVDYVSVGALIHQAQSLDLSLKAVIL